MKRGWSAVVCACVLGVLAGCVPAGRRSIPEGEQPLRPDRLVVCHYFTWFKTPEIGGYWRNWEWKGKGPQHDPRNLRPDGRRDIASVFYPMIGPYDSSDPTVMEYHMLSARAAKIDGFFLDWYGIPSDEDRAFPLLLDMGQALGLKMCICFEDKAMFGYHYQVRSREEAVENAVENLRHILRTHAAHPAYLRIDGLPVVINFSWSEPAATLEPKSDGFSAAEWKTILDRVRAEHPVYFVHDYHCHLRESYWDGVDNMYPWLDVNGDCLDGFYREAGWRRAAGQYGFLTSLVYPGFDNTGVWGWGDGPFVTPREDGALYQRLWSLAESNDVRLLQIATWNDFGEGATIEPTVEYGFQYLDLTERLAAGFKGLTSDGGRAVRLAYRVYVARRRIQARTDADAGSLAEWDRLVGEAVQRLTLHDLEGAAGILEDVEGQLAAAPGAI